MNNTILSKKKKKYYEIMIWKGNEPDFYLTQPQEQKRSCFMKEQSFNSQLIKKKNKEWNEGLFEETHLSNWISTGTQSLRLAFQLFQSSSSNL